MCIFIDANRLSSNLQWMESHLHLLVSASDSSLGSDFKMDNFRQVFEQTELDRFF